MTHDETLTEVLRGRLAPDGDRTAVRFRRAYPTTVDDLWAAVVEPARAARWLGTLTGELHEDGRYHLTLGDDDGDHAAGRIRTCAAPHLLEVDWTYPGETESWVRLELAADGPARALLVLEHRRLPTATAVGYGAGWHAYLDALADDLTGAPTRPWEDRFAEHLPGYRAAAADASGRAAG